ncbi:MAG: exodeoxyribonuclease VII large subunit [Deltaproteobacteria bacterium HGW-Deltaproteobacteria-6]|nr:MAG: exodeoxyribonuclease VII large subunit [Deltaproteobacteria bacterium HGW-Deltaproteobacteria-6]
MKDFLTVSQLNDNIKTFLEETFGSLWVEGEVSNLRRPQSGHVYFTLKDDKSQVRAVYFRPYGYSQNRAPKFDLEDGMKILCRARLSAYPPRGEYQLLVESIEPQGVGALQIAFEQLKIKLATEGLFDESRKKALPFLPRRIGVVTSPTGAVIRDILNITRRRFPSVHILIAPTRVQGNDAAAEIISALRRLHAHGSVDIIIIARGGGSLEDLAPFNDESLAREIFHSPIPIVSAIGHETDFTICDFVADLRAPTPSAAAELVVPLRVQLQDRIQNLRQRLVAGERRHLDDQKEQLASLQARFKDPRRFLIDYSIHLDDLRERIQRAVTQNTQAVKSKLQRLELGLQSRNPERRIREKRISLDHLGKGIADAWNCYFKDRGGRLEKNAALLSSLNPLAVLQRGYSITRRLSNGEIVRQARGLTLDESVSIQLASGSIRARVEKINGE